MTSVLEKLFPLWRIRNVAMFYLLTIATNAWFVAGVWVFIWGRFMTNSQIGLSDAITFSIGFLVELPSGVIADVIGRRKAILIGNILLVIGNFFIAISSSFVGITWWYLIWTIGYAFQSGATEALAYDTLKRQKLEKNWPQVMAQATVIAKTTTLIATAVGGWLFTIWFRLPYLTLTCLGVIGVLAAFALQEIQVQNKNEVWSWRFYLNQIKDGVGVLGRNIVFPVASIALTITGISYMYNWGLLRPLTAQRFGYEPQAYALLLSFTSLVCIGAVSVFPQLRKAITLERFLVTVAFLFALTFTALGLNWNWLIGGALMTALTVCSLYIDILFSEFVNLHTREEHRATTLSAVALFTRLPYVVLALLIGRLADQNLLSTYMLIVGMISVGIVMISGLIKWSTTGRNKSKAG